MKHSLPNLGLGIGWRPEIALPIDRRTNLGFVEIVAEDFNPGDALPLPIENLRERGVTVIPHGVSLSLGSAQTPDQQRLYSLSRLAERCKAPLVSEHLAFVRGGGLETGHLLPLPRSREVLEIVVANVQIAKQSLPVPLAIENITSLVEWPHPEMEEVDFLVEVLERADVHLLLDIENVYANARNHGFDAMHYLDRLPLHRIAYIHVAGGIERNGLYHDTHAHAIPVAVLELLTEIYARAAVPGVMLERDDHYPSDEALNLELDAIANAVTKGSARRLGLKNISHA